MRQILLAILVIGTLLSGVTFAAAEEEEHALEAEKIEFEHEVRLRELDIEARQEELEFESQMRELEIQERRTEIERSHRGSGHHKQEHGGFMCLIVLVMIIIRILSTIWVCRDLSQRKTGSGLWIPIVLLAGLFGLLVYAVTRLGDIQQAKTQTE